MTPFERLLLKYSKLPQKLSYTGEDKEEHALELSKLTMNLGQHGARSFLKSYSFELSETNSQILVNYNSMSSPFLPEREKYFEPDWKQYTKDELDKAIKYLSKRVDFLISPGKKQDIGLLIFKDKFYLSVRIPSEYKKLKEHCICFAVYGASLYL